MCGAAWAASLLQAAVPEVHVVAADVSADALREARSLVAENGLPISVLPPGDLFAPVRDAGFAAEDCVTAIVRCWMHHAHSSSSSSTSIDMEIKLISNCIKNDQSVIL